MSNELGMIIGKIKQNMSITNHNDEKVQISVTFDFSTSTDAEIKGWLCGNRAIVFQRPARSLSMKELMDLDGTVVMANAAGTKVKSRTDRIAELVAVFENSGLAHEMALQLATAAVDNPSALTIKE